MSYLLDSILCGAILLLAFIVFVNPNKVNQQANIWFGVFIGCLFLVAVQNVLLYAELLTQNEVPLEVINIADFAIAPIFYLSVLYYVEPAKRWKNSHYWYFTFAFLALTAVLISIAVRGESPPNEVDERTMNTIENIFNVVFAAQVITFCLGAYVKLSKHQKNIQNINSTVAPVNLAWLRNVGIGVIVIAVLWLVDIIFSFSDKNQLFDVVSSVVYLLGTFYISYYYLKQQEIFPYNEAEQAEVKQLLHHIDAGNTKPLLADDKLEDLKTKLQVHFETQKPFLKPDLTLIKLAEQLNISTHLLSYVINKGFNENFYKLINRYRIEEAKKFIADKNMEHLNLLGIAYEAGFNSKTVFNATFKKNTGHTPSQYKKRNQSKEC